jgi:hypothetical protein
MYWRDWNMRWTSLLMGLAVWVYAAPVLAVGLTFSIDFQGPTTGVLDAFIGFPITEGDVLTVGIPGPLGPNPPVPGIGPFPPGREVGALPGSPGVAPGGLGIAPGISGFVELESLA